MNKNTPAVLGAGSPIVDLLVSTDDCFLKSIAAAKGGMELVDQSMIESLLTKIPGNPVKAPGGSAGNTIFGLARLGVPVAFLGKVGTDADGDYYRKRLVELGGRDTSFRLDSSAHTGRCVSMITPDSERTMRTDLGAAARMTAAEVLDSDFANIAHVHIEGYLLFVGDLAEKVLSTAKKHGCTVSLDLATFELVKFKRDILPGLLKKYVDIVFANEDEAGAFCGDISPEQMAEKLGEYCAVAAVKLGKEGSCIKDKNGIVRVPAELVKAVDTTGAGDLWQAGFLYGYLKGCPMTDCASFGSITAAEVVQVIGADIPEERWTVIRKKLQA